MATGAEPLKALGVELPIQVERETLDFMKDKRDGGLFSSKLLQLGIIGTMREKGLAVDSLPDNWPRRITDALIRRESKAGNIEKCGPGGPASFWKWRDI